MSTRIVKAYDRDYVHYGSKIFDPELFKTVRNNRFPRNKPGEGGLWASPVDAEYGWRDFCTNEAFHEESLKQYFIFSLKEGSKIFELIDASDLAEIPRLKPETSAIGLYTPSLLKNIYPDFEEMVRQGYDAIVYEPKSGPGYESLHYGLYGWDCDCILVLNPECMIMKKEARKGGKDD